MNDATLYGLITAGMFLVAVFFGLALCRAAARTPATEEPRGQRVWDFDAEDWVDLPPGAEPGPKQRTSRQLEDMSGLDLLYLSRAYDPATDPQWAAGRERLFDATRDHQKGDQT